MNTKVLAIFFWKNKRDPFPLWLMDGMCLDDAKLLASKLEPDRLSLSVEVTDELGSLPVVSSKLVWTKDGYDLRVYDQPILQSNVKTVEEFVTLVNEARISDDIEAFWVKDGKQSSDSVFASKAEDATHVAVYERSEDW